MDGYNFRDVEAFAARMYRDTGKNFRLVPYGYTTTFASIAQGATSTNTINIAANADFILLEIRHRANIGAAQTVSTKTAPFIRMLVTDSGTNEQFTNAAVDLENYAQNGNSERPLQYPRFLQGRTSLTVQCTSYAPTNETYAVDVYFSGVLAYTY